MAAPKPITFPAVFPADLSYRAGSFLFSLVGVIGISLSAGRHQTMNLIVILIPFTVFLVALVLTLTFQLRVDETGLHQRSLFGRKDAAWEQISRVDQGRAYSLYDADGKEVIWLHMVTTVVQKAIAEEAIRRGGLQPSGAKLEYPVRQQWIRK